MSEGRRVAGGYDDATRTTLENLVIAQLLLRKAELCDRPAELRDVQIERHQWQLTQTERRAGRMTGRITEDQTAVSREIDGLFDALDQLDVASDLELSS